MPGTARQKDDLNHLDNDKDNVDDYIDDENAPISHLVERFDNREVSFNSERDGQIDTASHGALEKRKIKLTIKKRIKDFPAQWEDCTAQCSARCDWRKHN